MANTMNSHFDAFMSCGSQLVVGVKCSVLPCQYLHNRFCNPQGEMAELTML